MNLLLLAGLLAAGFITRKLNLIGEQETESIPKLLFTFFYPSLTIFTIAKVKSYQIGDSIVVLAIFTAIVTLATFIVTRIVLRGYKDADRMALLHFKASIGNVVYVLIPIVSAIWGTTAVTYCVIISSVQDIFIWTLYYAEFSGIKKGIRGLKNLLSPVTLALVAGLILSFSGIQIPRPVDNMLSILSGAVSPLAFIFMGSILAEKLSSGSLKFTFDSMIATLVRVTLLPLAVYFAAVGIGLSTGIAAIVALSFATPLPVMAVVWAQMYKKDTNFAVSDLIFSTMAFCGMYAILSIFRVFSNIVF